MAARGWRAQRGLQRLSPGRATGDPARRAMTLRTLARPANLATPTRPTRDRWPTSSRPYRRTARPSSQPRRHAGADRSACALYQRRAVESSAASRGAASTSAASCCRANGSRCCSIAGAPFLELSARWPGSGLDDPDLDKSVARRRRHRRHRLRLGRALHDRRVATRASTPARLQPMGLDKQLRDPGARAREQAALRPAGRERRRQPA